jgi:20S proteasome alpha/beta subunit
MTTIIGIQAEEGIVLFSDTQALDLKTKQKLQEPYHKIKVVGEYCVFAFAGFHVKYEKSRKFFCNGNSKSVRGLKEKLDSGFIKEYHESMEDISTLVAMRIDEPILYMISHFGHVTKLRRRVVALGSGSKYAKEFLLSNLNGNRSLDYAIRIGYKAMKQAFRDINTGGFVDFAVVTQDEIYKEGVNAHRKVLGLEKAIIAAAQERYRIH